MNHSTPGLPVNHQLPGSTQTHVHWVDDAIQPSHPLSSPSPALNLSQHQGLFQGGIYSQLTIAVTSVTYYIIITHVMHCPKISVTYGINSMLQYTKPLNLNELPMVFHHYTVLMFFGNISPKECSLGIPW